LNAVSPIPNEQSDGVVSLMDIRNPTQPLSLFKRSTSALKKLEFVRVRDQDFVLMGSSDGACALLDRHSLALTMELIGGETDNLTGLESVLSSEGKGSCEKIFSAGRNGLLRCFQF
jgi:hypothetical protein